MQAHAGHRFTVPYAVLSSLPLRFSRILAGILVYSLALKSGYGYFPIEGFQINAVHGRSDAAIAGSPFTVYGGYAQFDQSGAVSLRLL